MCVCIRACICVYVCKPPPPHTHTQVKGSPDLRFPPPEIVTGGRDAIINFLMSNMRYEDTQNLAAKEEVLP